MKKNWKNLLTVAIMASAAMIATSCSSDDDDPVNPAPTPDPTPVVPEDNTEAELKVVNKNFVEKTVQLTYSGLADATIDMISALEAFGESNAQSDLDKAGEAWKDARQYWEWSEAFLFGAASGYGIDPHIDTWPFDAASFNTYMSKFNPASDEGDAAILEEAIATGQNLTGFHAVEYLIFRNGEVRKAEEITDDELWFCITASNDLYLSASKLVAAWGGKLSDEQEEMLEEAEFEADNFGDEFTNAGEKGSRWPTISNAAVNIIEGCQDIIDEVAHSKIGAPFTGEDVSYIESPHAWNSIVDFYDNVMSCKNALYGLEPSVANYDNKTPAAGSLMAFCKNKYATEAEAAMSALENALDKVNAMKKPFVNNYTDASAGAAIEALEALDEALGKLKQKLNN